MKGMDLTYFLHLLLQELVLLDDLLVAALLLLLVLLALAGVVRVLPDEEDLGDEDEAHREEAAEEVGHRHEAEGRVLLIACIIIKIKSGLGGLEVSSKWTASKLFELRTNDEHDRGGDEAEDDDIVCGHPDEAGVVDLAHLLGARLVGQEEAQDQLEAFVSV